MALSPFEFELSVKVLKQKFLYESNIIPFKAHFSARSISAAVDIVREIIQYIPLGALIALSMNGRKTFIWAGLGGFCLAFFIELLQLSVIGRYVDLTDSLLAAAGAVMGALLLPLFKKGSS
jgi:glycopeptide antibiotics resistance protein